LNDLAWLFSLEQFGIKFGLANIRSILERLGSPERAYRAVHIAGTNGKGSVTAMVDAGLRAAGHRTGRYTSPHLVRLNERFAVDGRSIDDDRMLDAVRDVHAAVDGLRADGTLDVQPTFFEATTAVGFELFRRAGIDVAVVEVGMGGRLDATNVLIPDVTAITSIGLDHQRYLGSTLADIAAEKAGIIKPGIPVVLGEMEPAAAAVIERTAGERGAPVLLTTAADIGTRTVGLRGEHQRKNAAVALRLLELLDARGVAVPEAARAAALATADWPGRLDLRRLEDGREILLDAAHNPAGAEALAAYLAGRGERLPLVFAAMRDKEVAGMFRALLPNVSSLTITRATTARSADPDELARIARETAPKLPVTIEAALPRALDAAWRQSDRRRIVAAGSIFLLGDVMQHLGLHC
jgi:dihydrofolate synthase / folylpolyglutamate synthase